MAFLAIGGQDIGYTWDLALYRAGIYASSANATVTIVKMPSSSEVVVNARRESCPKGMLYQL